MTDNNGVPGYIRLALTGSTTGEVRWCKDGESIPAGTPYACLQKRGWSYLPDGLDVAHAAYSMFVVAVPADMVLVPRSLVERAKAWDAAAIYCHHINDARSILGDLAAVDLPETGADQ